MMLTMGPTPGKPRAQTSFDPAVIPPAKIAPFVVWLCTDAAANVNGRTFHVSGDDVALLSEPVPERVIHRTGGWDLDALDTTAPRKLVEALTNDFALDDHPELHVFEE
jgi:hypothetical protein